MSFELAKIQQTQSELLSFDLNNLYHPQNDDVIISVDVVYHDFLANVGIDVIRYPNQHLETFTLKDVEVKGKYEPQYFAFYEGPVVVEVVNKLKTKYSNIALVIVDGHGLAHPRRFGLACYVGLELDMPCFGIAKSNLLKYDKSALSFEKYSSINFEVDNEIVGVGIRLQNNVNPVFISQGNKIDLNTCIEITKNLTSEFKYPDNMRRADMASKENYR